MARLSIYLHGPYEIYLDDVKVDGLYSQARALLAFLVIESHRKHSREKLSEMLWPDDPRDLAKQNLRQAISRLRLALGDRESPEQYILATRTDIQFNPLSDFWCDSEAFKFAICAYQQNDGKAITVESLGWMQESAELYRGHFLEHFQAVHSDHFNEWRQTIAESLKYKAIAVVEQLSRYYEKEGDGAEALNTAYKLVSIERWAEAPRRLLIRLLFESGQDVVALAQIDSCRAMLRDELGVEPSPEAQSLFDYIHTNTAKNDGVETKNSHSVDACGTEHDSRRVTILSCSIDLTITTRPDKIIEAVREFAETCRTVASRYGGFPYAISGDECSICFGYPAVQENSEILAARAAMALRKIYHKSRVGKSVTSALCSGDVLVVSYEGAALPHLIGEPVTQADFLRHIASPGECALSDATYHGLRHQFSCQRRRNPAMDSKLAERFYFLLQYECECEQPPAHKEAV
ncbi:MAG: winged helix-turn-helix domain-containing protein [Agarilytica sp.]